MFRWTNRVVELDGNTTAKFESTKITNRCTVLYKVIQIYVDDDFDKYQRKHTMVKLKSTKITNRCTVLYKVIQIYVDDDFDNSRRKHKTVNFKSTKITNRWKQHHKEFMLNKTIRPKNKRQSNQRYLTSEHMAKKTSNQFQPTNCTGPIKLTCSKFLVDNRY